MSKFYNFFPFLFLFFISCNIISFEELEISSNIQKSEIYFSDTFILINFSITPDKNSAEKLISLKESSSNLELDIIWDENKCKIAPIHGFKKNENYLFQINGKISTADKRNYDISYERTFIYGTENDHFVLSSFNNPDKTESKPELILTFNRPVDISSFEDNFSITPSISVVKNYSPDNKQVVITPIKKWDVNTYYTWLLKRTKSKDCYETENEYSQTFIYGTDYLLPKLISSNLNKIKINEPMLFTFNKPINLESFETYFSITPYIKGYITKDDKTIKYYPVSNFEINKEYTVCISSKICDENAMTLYENIYKTFKPINDFLKVISISINETTNIPLNDDSITQININHSDLLFIEIQFSDQIKIDKLSSAEKAVILEPFFPDNLQYPKLSKVSWNEGRSLLSLTYTNISKISEEQLYKISVNSTKTGFITENDEYMEKDICAYFTIN